MLNYLHFKFVENPHGIFKPLVLLMCLETPVFWCVDTQGLVQSFPKTLLDLCKEISVPDVTKWEWNIGVLETCEGAAQFNILALNMVQCTINL